MSNGFKPTGFGPKQGFHFPARFGFTGSSGAYTNVSPHLRQLPRAFKDGGYVSQSMPDPGSAFVRRERPYAEWQREAGATSKLLPGYKHGGKMKDGGKWIQGAIQHPGALHKALGVPTGKKIPAKKLAKAAHSDNPTMRRRAALAKTLGKMHKADGGSVPRRIKDYSMAEGLSDIPALAREGVDAIRRAMSQGRRAVGEQGRSIMQQTDTDVSGKTMASRYSRGGKMKRMGYANGGAPTVGYAPAMHRPMLPMARPMRPMTTTPRMVATPPRAPMMARSKGGMTRYAKGGMTRYANGGAAHSDEAQDRPMMKRIAQEAIGEHVRYPAPKGHKGLEKAMPKRR